VVESLKAKGAVFVEDLSEVRPTGSLFQRPGVSQRGSKATPPFAARRINATAVVTKVHNQGKRYAGKGRVLILIATRRHPEVEGSKARFPLLSIWFDVQDVGRLDFK